MGEVCIPSLRCRSETGYQQRAAKAFAAYGTSPLLSYLMRHTATITHLPINIATTAPNHYLCQCDANDKTNRNQPPESCESPESPIHLNWRNALIVSPSLRERGWGEALSLLERGWERLPESPESCESPVLIESLSQKKENHRCTSPPR